MKHKAGSFVEKDFLKIVDTKQTFHGLSFENEFQIVFKYLFFSA